jgi:TetR/AcrR family fatty acid metabolism transcriptional regulator
MREANRRRGAPPRADKRRSQILAAAVELFSKRGFYETGVEDIARAAGISKGTIYNYFDDKRTLFMATIEWSLRELTDALSRSVQGIANPVHKLETAMQTYLSFFQRNRNLYRIIFIHRSTHRDKAELRFTKKYLTHFYLFEGILTEGIERNVFKNVNVNITSSAIVGIIHALYHEWLLSDESMSRAGTVSQIMDLVFDGLVNKRSMPATRRGAADVTETTQQRRNM